MGMKLLIVDDHPTNLKLLRAQLEAEGHSVVEAANGVEALQVLEHEGADGVISDILMPQMDGFRLCLQVRKSARCSEIPFVFYTATYDSLADRKLAESAGADAYFVKPAPTHAILEALQSASSRSHASGVATAAIEIESSVLKLYNAALVGKLEDKCLDLERACDELSQMEARLSGLVEGSMDGIIAIDDRQEIVLFNAAAGRIFGCAPTAAIGRPLNDFIPHKYRKEHSADIHRFEQAPLATRRMGGREVWGLRADGSEFPIEVSISKLETAQGTLHTAFVRDITDRHRIAQALAHSEAGLRHAQEIARIAHAVSGPDGAFESWSETLPRLIGVDDAHLPRSTREWLQVVHPDDREAFRTVSIEAARGGHRCEIDYRVRRHDTWIDVHHVMEQLSQETDSGQQGRQWYNTVQDVSAQKQVEARIRGLNRVYAVLSGINMLIVRIRDRDELFREACRIAVDDGKFSKAWIGVFETGQSAVRIAAWHGADHSVFEGLQAQLQVEALREEGLVALASRGIEPVVANDIEHDPRIAGREALTATGSRSVALFPLVIDGKSVGLFSLHATSTGFFDSEEMKLLGELADDIAFALNHIANAEHIRYLSSHDALTGLPNRVRFTDHLAQRIDAMDGDHGMLAVVLLDLERFRRVNETLGRASGDVLLKMVAARLQQANPSVARIGMDLFAIEIATRTSVTDIARDVEELSARCFAEPFVLGGDELRIGCRAGIAVFPDDGVDAETLLRNAESASRSAKATTEHCVFYAIEMNVRAGEALALESRLRRAIERQEFVLHYQPKVLLSDGRITGVEALIRWQDPEHGLLPPAGFISVLEESGLIAAVGRWALGQAMADHRRWRDAGLGSLCVAVNVSPLQLHQPDFAAHIAEVVAEDGGAALELEITESLIMDNVVRNVATLREIRDHGVNISIDDFGTGYSSLSYIAKLPITELKIDREFVIGMTEGPDGMVMVTSIIALAHALKLKVVAEGVETEEQASRLQSLGCDEAQGYLYCKPVPADAIEALLRAGGSLLTRQPA